METFNLTRDDHVTVWIRSRYKVEANSLEEAIELVKNEEVDILDCYQIDGTVEILEPGIINNNPTIEIFDKNIDNILWHN